MQRRRERRRELFQQQENKFQTSQRSKRWICRHDVPYRLARSAYLFKMGYLTVIIMFSVLVFQVPRTEALTKADELKPGYQKAAISLVAVTFAALFLVQGSNPGYIEVKIPEPKGASNPKKQKVDNSESLQSIELSSISTQSKVKFSQEDTESKEKAPKESSDGLINSQRHSRMVELFESEEFLLEDGGLTSSDDISTSDSSDDGSDGLLEDRDAVLSGIPSEDLPIRSKYCRHSRNFVAKYDHFCAILNTTIGQKNHFRFLLFLMVNAVTVGWGLYICFSGIHDTTSNVWFKQNFHALLMTILFLFFAGISFGLMFFHCFLMCSNITTYEFMRTEKVHYLKNRGLRDFDLPFSHGLFGNIKEFVVKDGMWSIVSGKEWTPTTWQVHPFERESEDVWNNIWENKYWSCC